MMNVPRLLRSLAVLLLAGLVLPGCIDDIQLDGQDRRLDNMVVQGKLVKGDPSIVEVATSRLKRLGDNVVNETIGVRGVVLHDDAGNALPLTQTAIGMYRNEIPAAGGVLTVETGKSYYITVETLDGQLIESRPDELQPIPLMDSVQVRPNQVEELNEAGVPGLVDHLAFGVFTPLQAAGQPAGARLRWLLEGIFKLTQGDGINGRLCYMTDFLNRYDVFLLPRELLNSAYLDFFEVVNLEVTSRFAEGYYLSVYQESLSDQAYEYWRNVRLATNRTGSIIETPAGPFNGNLRDVNDPENAVYGLFYVTAQDTARIYVSPETAGNPRRNCPIPFSSMPPPPPTPCTNCLAFTGSSLIAPYYWEE